MNREQEYNNLLQEFQSTPPALDDVVTRVFAKNKRRKIIHNCFTIPTGTAASIFIMFIIMINISPVFASAMDHVPSMRSFVEAISFSSSLTEAVKQEFVQTVWQEQTIDDAITIRLEYMIVDGDMVHIFYTVHSLIDTNFGLGFGAFGTDIKHDKHVDALLILSMDPRRDELEDGEIRTISFGFGEPVPPIVIWEGEVHDRGADNVSPGHVIGSYFFTIDIDDAQTGQESIDVYQDFAIDGQRFTITTVQLNPVHTRVNLETDWVNNTELLQRLVFHMINERGEQFNPPTLESGGLINLPAGGVGFDGSLELYDGPWRLEDHFLETAFFAQSESLTLVITGVEWIGMEWFGADTIQLDEPILIRVK
ncbi:MAG: DUF4179 domain-containing protein [Oscillospiraceae bacterium]|jgi:hypothetical protein|nr:DUF4179 domain-containing protein [Oscillospiraceae bacterium]